VEIAETSRLSIEVFSNFGEDGLEKRGGGGLGDKGREGLAS